MGTNGDIVTVWFMVETWADRAVKFGHGEYQLENRSAQKGSRSARQGERGPLDRERHNVDDAASFLVELVRLAAVDEWEQGHAVQIRADGERHATSTARPVRRRRACWNAGKR